MKTLVDQRVADAMANFEAARNAGSDGGTGCESYQGENQGPPRALTYKDFMNHKPNSFYGDKGVAGLTRLIQKPESIFEINFCAKDCKVKFTTRTLMDVTCYIINKSNGCVIPSVYCSIYSITMYQITTSHNLTLLLSAGCVTHANTTIIFHHRRKIA